MNIDFIAILADDYTIKIYDITPISDSLPQDIYAMTLNIISSKIPNGQIDNRLDALAYLKLQRMQDEIYTIRSEHLGLPASIKIPDGVYHIQYAINNGLMIREHKFLVFRNVEEAVNEMLEEVNYDIEVGDYDISYVGDASEYDIEKVRLAVTLLDSLKSSAMDAKEVVVNDTLDKLTRLLGIINNNINT